ncbi:uncharacterized protein Corp [Drosophila kikkawai]|uniref:Uncharacterized protein Corp n=1 Tax=Drosophila kikkawai TaxID=30033 RepID=A0A6P4IJU5_DROKI|nr:uncharacterized protein LOC108078994 [Drosophila kikkawai]
MAARSCLKVLFQGETSFIICESFHTYEEVISQAMSHFGIPKNHRDALTLSNGQGYVFEAQLLEYFLLLFPSPEITFHLRLDWQQLRRGLTQTRPQKRKRPVERVDVSSTGSQKVTIEEEKPNEEQAPVQDYKPVAVYRQNCFLGALPSNGAAAVRRQNCFLREQKQQRREEPRPRSQPEVEEELTQTQGPQVKRLRLDLCPKSRRPATTSGAPHSLPVMRPIRI